MEYYINVMSLTVLYCQQRYRFMGFGKTQRRSAVVFAGVIAAWIVIYYDWLYRLGGQLW